MPKAFGLTFAATERTARDAIVEVLHRLEGSGLTPDETDRVQIALAEAVNNVVEHAYGTNGRGRIALHCRIAAHRLSLRICDRGIAPPQGFLPPGHSVDVSGPRESLPEGGFGWFLIRRLTSEVSYDRLNGFNRLTLHFDRRAAAG